MDCGIFLWLIFLVAGILGAVIWVQGRDERARRAQPASLFPVVPAPLPAPKEIPLPRSVSIPGRSRRQASPSAADRFWVPAGGSATVAGRRVPGMVYCGKGLRALAPYRDSEPALLDPDRAVRWSQPDREGRMMGYWPFYSAIDPASRAAHLEWLSAGRGPGAYIGYVFLFFYGIERRVLVDAAESEQARAEIRRLCSTKVERLLAIYGGNSSFRGYARIVSLLRAGSPIAPSTSTSYAADGEPRVGAAAAAARSRSASSPRRASRSPPEWALSWVDQLARDPACGRRPSAARTSFASCSRSATWTFKDGGLIVRPNKTTIATFYHPASPTFGGQISLKVDLPDVTGLASPASQAPGDRRLRPPGSRRLQPLGGPHRRLRRPRRGVAPAAGAGPRSRERGEHTIRAVGRGEPGRGGARPWSAARTSSRSGRSRGKGSSASATPRCWPLSSPGAATARSRMSASVDRLPGAGPAVLFRLFEGLGTGAERRPIMPPPSCSTLAAALSVADGEVTVREERHLLAHLEGALHLLRK